MGSNKNKLGSIISTIIIILIIIYALISYPFFTKVKDGKTICTNILGTVKNCR